MASPELLRSVMDKAGSKQTAVTYNRFEFRHADVMGSGRFTYASAPMPATVKLREK